MATDAGGPDVNAGRRTIAVTGATGLQGGALARRLHDAGNFVRALTRNPDGPAARALAGHGIEVVAADMSDADSLRRAFSGAHGVFSVQNPVLSGLDAEVLQGIHVAEAARDEGVAHLVYSSAGVGSEPTGVPSWDSKLRVERHIQELDVPFTILRPMAFMELMTERKFYPEISTWQVMPALMGADRPVFWLAVDDLAEIAARVFANTERYVGRSISLVADSQSIDACRAIYREVFGRNPPRLPVPAWLFARFGFVGKDLTAMWRWLRTAKFEADLEAARSIHPGAWTVRSWLARRAVPSSTA